MGNMNKILFAKENRIIVFSISILTFLIFVILFYKYICFEHTYPHYSFREYNICEKSQIKADGKIKITEKGVCFEKSICEQLVGIVECENLDDSDYGRDNKVVKNLNKNNFDFENIDARIDRILFTFKENNKVVYLNNKKYFEIKNVDLKTFQYLGGKYSKDTNNVYYKNEIIPADPETFIYEKGKGKAIGKGRDKNGTWIKGFLKQ